MKFPLLAAIFILSPLAALFTSCSSMGASGTEALLSAAGFKVKSPETAQQRDLYTQLPSYKLQRGKHEDKIFYAFKDEKQGVAYVGGEKEYQRYQQLATQRDIARDQRMAAEMQRDMSFRWYGAYGPYYRPFY